MAFANPPFFFRDPAARAFCFRGRSGDSASLIAVDPGAGIDGRREDLPYVMAFFRRSGAVNMEDIDVAMLGGGKCSYRGGILEQVQKVTQTRIVIGGSADPSGDEEQTPSSTLR